MPSIHHLLTILDHCLDDLLIGCNKVTLLYLVVGLYNDLYGPSLPALTHFLEVVCAKVS